jgi:signal recognition particle receptor subunit beta
VVLINSTTMQATVKIVYYGPGLCGKTTNLLHIHQKTAARSRGEMISLETESDRTLFFDLLPLEVGMIGGMRVRLQLYTVPGQVFYNATRQLVLRAVDGIVFVADSQEVARDANLESLRNLGENLAELGLDREPVPLVYQYNKRDLKQILAVEALQADLNPRGLPYFEGAALHGLGVFETLKGITKAALVGVKRRVDEERRVSVSSPASPVPAEPPVVHPWVEGRPVASPAAADGAPSDKTPTDGAGLEFAAEDTGERVVRPVETHEGREIRERLERLRSAAGAVSSLESSGPPSGRAEPATADTRDAFRPTCELSRRAVVRVPRRVLEAATDVAVHLSFGGEVVVTDVVVGRLPRQPEGTKLSLHLDIEIEEQK